MPSGSALSLSSEEVAGLAPDAAGLAAGRKLAAGRHWEGLGRSDAAAWGECRGSAVYQVKADLGNFGTACSCPSRKFPCKHALALLLILAEGPANFAEELPPEWVTDWLAKREARTAKQAEQKAETAAAPVDEAARRKRAAQREGRVRDGLETLTLWLSDLARGGLAGVETRPASFWDEPAKRLVDAQAPGLAGRVAALAELPGSSSDWPERLAGEIGRTALLVEAYRRIDSLEAPLAADVRQLIGWNPTAEEVEREGERVADAWDFVGQRTEDDGRLRTRRTWAVGAATGRVALLLDFAAGGQPFVDPLPPGTRQRGTLTFYPGAAGRRARVAQRDGPPGPIPGRPAGCASIAGFLDTVTDSLARQPWQPTFGGVLRDVTLVPGPVVPGTVVPGPVWHARDAAGEALPLAGPPAWAALAQTGGGPGDLAGEWDGRTFRPLGLWTAGRFGVM